MKVRTETRSFYERALDRVVRHIVGHLDEALDLGSLGRQAALSPFHFHRVFRGMLGETPLELQRRLRLERAATALLTSDASVTAVAFDAGYETHEAFTRAFRQAYGQAPSVFRQTRADERAGCARPPSVEIAAPSGLHFPVDAELFALNFVQGEAAMNVVIENLPAQRVAAVRHVGPYSQIGEAFGRLGELAGPAGLMGRPGARMLGIYHDDPEGKPAAELQADAGLTIPVDAPVPEGLHEITLPAGRYARATHMGPYDQLGDAWSRLMGQWLPASGERVRESASFELYHNTPGNAAPSELRTDLYIPLA